MGEWKLVVRSSWWGAGSPRSAPLRWVRGSPVMPLALAMAVLYRGEFIAGITRMRRRRWTPGGTASSMQNVPSRFGGGAFGKTARRVAVAANDRRPRIGSPRYGHADVLKRRRRVHSRYSLRLCPDRDWLGSTVARSRHVRSTRGHRSNMLGPGWALRCGFVSPQIARRP